MKPPAFQFYVRDWLSDTELQKCSPASRGVWANLLCHMWLAQDRGVWTGTIEQLARCAMVTPEQALVAAQELLATGAAGGTCPANVPTCPENVLLINRRMKREEDERKYERDKKKRQREKLPGNCPLDCPANVPPLSASASASATAKPEENRFSPPTPNSQNGDQTKPKFDPAEVVEAAKAKRQALDESGDTPLVHELGRILGNDKIDHATWCKLDGLAIGQRCIRGTRERVTDMLVTLARAAVADGAEKPAAAFMHTMLTRYPKLAELWKQ